MRKTVPRLFRHLFTTTAAGRRVFPNTALDAIQKAIAIGEKRHQAEIRLIVEPAMPLYDVLYGISARERTHQLFSLYRIWDTETNAGILIYINLADRKVEIIADRAANRAIKREEWHAVCRTMTEGFGRNAFHESTIAGLAQLNDLLAERLPSNGASTNELSNRPLML